MYIKLEDKEAEGIKHSVTVSESQEHLHGGVIPAQVVLHPFTPQLSAPDLKGLALKVQKD